jgi:outer membrane murein-binding lipoprotein Lpp
MDEARTTRQLSLSRNLGLAMTFLALMGGGTAYFARASTAVQQQLRGEVAQLKVTQDQLLAERDQARAHLAAAQQEVMVLTKLLEESQDKASSTGSVSPPIPASKPPRTPAQTKGKGR